ncbi:hypothetical protein B0H11DRAFT_2008366 [Mycena galericulata]|nr:hypothetical protein B0H11DRAFT_2008366 [Mycena galericulata]
MSLIPPIACLVEPTSPPNSFDLPDCTESRPPVSGHSDTNLSEVTDPCTGEAVRLLHYHNYFTSTLKPLFQPGQMNCGPSNCKQCFTKKVAALCRDFREQAQGLRTEILAADKTRFEWGEGHPLDILNDAEQICDTLLSHLPDEGPELGDGRVTIPGPISRSPSIGSLSQPNSLASPPEIGSLVEAYDWGETQGTMLDDVDLTDVQIRNTTSHRPSLPIARQPSNVQWSTHDLEQFFSMLPSTALTQSIVNQISSKLPSPYKTRAQVRECYDLLLSAGYIAEPPSASNIGRCLSVLQSNLPRSSS